MPASARCSVWASPDKTDTFDKLLLTIGGVKWNDGYLRMIQTRGGPADKSAWHQ